MSFPADYEEWDESVCATYPLKKFFIENENAKIKLFSSRKKPKFLTNAPYLEEGGILIKKPLVKVLENDIKELFNEFDLNYILFKSRESVFSEVTPAAVIDSSYYTFLLDVSSGIDDVWKNKLKSKTRNQVRKAEKYNFNIRFGQKELLDDFYTVISTCWRDLGTPVHSYQFFQNVLNNFGDKVSIVVQYDKGTPVSTALIFILDNVLSHPFAGTINKYKPTSANNLLYWSIIKFACENDVQTFDMGRSKSQQGTYNFKKSWGGVAENIYYYYFIKDNVPMPTYDKTSYKIATSLWKNMPIALANKLGPKLIYKIL